MKAIFWASILAAVTGILTGCATGSSSDRSAAPRIGGYIDTSAKYHLK